MVAGTSTLLIKRSDLSGLSDTIRQNSVDYSENFTYTDYRTDVCVYKGVHRMKENKEKLIDKFVKLLNELAVSQIEFLYHLACRLFGHAPD